MLRPLGALPAPGASTLDSTAEAPVRLELVAPLRAAIESGQYRLDPDAIARALMKRGDA